MPSVTGPFLSVLKSSSFFFFFLSVNDDLTDGAGLCFPHLLQYKFTVWRSERGNHRKAVLHKPPCNINPICGGGLASRPVLSQGEFSITAPSLSPFPSSWTVVQISPLLAPALLPFLRFFSCIIDQVWMKLILEGWINCMWSAGDGGRGVGVGGEQWCLFDFGSMSLNGHLTFSYLWTVS